jgi:hypothetical protein
MYSTKQGWGFVKVVADPDPDLDPPDPDPTPDPTPFFIDFKDAQKLFFHIFFS